MTWRRAVASVCLRGGLAMIVIARTEPVLAQRLVGTVKVAGRDEPVPGAVVSSLDSLGNALTRGISDMSGRYSMALPAAAVRLRTVRIGFQPKMTDLPRQRGALLTTDVEMMPVPALLSAVAVNDERVCANGSDRKEALALWEQARAGLLSSVVAREALPARARVMNYQRILALGTGSVVKQRSRVHGGVTTRPFLSAAPPDVLAKDGYLTAAEGGGQQFQAPDADVLLDDSFAATHCFSVRTADAAHEGAIGLAFTPAKSRSSVVDVSGVLWMETASPALRSIEFIYTDWNNVLAFAGAGGSLHFTTRPNGVTFIDDWSLHLPVLDSASSSLLNQLRESASKRVIQRSETGGFVLVAEWPDSSRWVTPLKPLRALVKERGSDAPFVGALVMFDAMADTLVADTSGHVQFYPTLPGRYLVRTTDTSAVDYLAPRTSVSEVDVTPGADVTVQLELPTLLDALRASCKDVDAPPNAAFLIARIVDSSGTNVVPNNVSVVASWPAPDDRRETQTVSVDGQGRFTVCGIPRDKPVMLNLTQGGVTFTTAPVMIPQTTVVESMSWAVDFRGLATVVAVKRATLRGRVTRLDNGKGVANADVWLPGPDVHVNVDSAGRFRAEGLPAGKTLVQVRGVGYGVRRDMIALTAGTETTRDFELEWQGQMLDTVLTIGKVYASGGLKGFEARRTSDASGNGYFVSDSAMRTFSGAPLSSIIGSRVSGVNMVPGPSGATYLVSTRTMCVGGVGATCSSPNCFVTVYVDGSLEYSAARGDPGPPPDMSRFSTSILAGVEFYPQSELAPPQFRRAGPGCGTLLIWTRER